MERQEFLSSIIREIQYSLSKGYLTQIQVQILNFRLFYKKTYRELVDLFKLSCQNVLVHCLKRTVQLMYWRPGMEGEGTSYLSEFDQEIFLKIIGNAADDCNCIPSVYAISLAYHLKKQRVSKAIFLLIEMNNNDLTSHFSDISFPSPSWIYNFINNTPFHIVSGQQIEFSRRIHCDAQKIISFFLIHSVVLQRDQRLLINMDETMLNAKRRLKVLGRKGRLPLVPEAVKVPHLTGCVAFTASGHVFDPLIILPSKKTLRTLEEFSNIAYFGSSNAGWMTKDLFTYFCILLICQISHYRLTLDDSLKNERFLLIVDGHKSRENFTALLLLYLFNVDLILLPSHCSHLLQPFDVAVASPLKMFFKDELSKDNCDLYFTGQGLSKQSAQNLRRSLIRAFLNSLRKSSTFKNIEAGFSASGIYPFNPDQPLSSEFAIHPQTNAMTDERRAELLKNYWLNSEEGLALQFFKENGRAITEKDFDIDIKSILSNIKKSSVDLGIGLSKIPPLFIESEDGITKIDLNS